MSKVWTMAAGVAATALTTALGILASSPAQPAQAAPGDQGRPNVVVLMSDDQTQDSMRYMDDVRRLIGGRGATFPTSVTNWPVCCPSRATFQTGQYAHNHGVLGNKPPLGGFGRLDTTRTLPVWLQRAGYYTAHIGKFLNGYERSPVGVPPGWSEWHGSKETYKFYGYQLLENGEINTYGSPDEDPDDPARPGTYSTDVYTNKAVELIDRRAPSSKPFFLSVAYLAPHSGGPNSGRGEPAGRCDGEAKPAKRHIGAFNSEPLPRPPSFNEADVSDKPETIATRPSLTRERIAEITRGYRCRGESLLAIDEGTKRVVDALRQSGELDDTLLIYTSDNGFFHGEHRIRRGKARVYEEAIRVPLLMRGPDVKRGVSVKDLAINADLAPTILDAANATRQPEFELDGQSLLPFTEKPSRKHGRELLIEQTPKEGEDGEPVGLGYDAIRNSRFAYVENSTGEVELYDLRNDPFQLTNQAGESAYADAQGALAKRLAGLRNCDGDGCRKRPALALKLPRKERGRRCTSTRDFVARVRNNSQSDLVKASFRVDGSGAGVDRSAPFERRIAPKLLRKKPRPEIIVDAELVDGRILTLHREVRICDRD